MDEKAQMAQEAQDEAFWDRMFDFVDMHDLTALGLPENWLEAGSPIWVLIAHARAVAAEQSLELLTKEFEQSINTLSVEIMDRLARAHGDESPDEEPAGE